MLSSMVGDAEINHGISTARTCVLSCFLCTTNTSDMAAYNGLCI